MQPALRRAVDGYRAIDDGDVPQIALRQEFIRLREPRQLDGSTADANIDRFEPSHQMARRRDELELVTRPPLTRMVHRSSRALALYLTAVYVAHLETRPGQVFPNQRHNVAQVGDLAPWCRLAGMTGPSQSRAGRARVSRALDEVCSSQVANIREPGARNRYSSWIMLDDSGSEDAIHHLGKADGPWYVCLRASFIRVGTSYCQPTEIAMLLGSAGHEHNWISVAAWPPMAKVQLSPSRCARNFYGITGETYIHVHELEEFGLLQIFDPMPGRNAEEIRDTINSAADGGRSQRAMTSVGESDQANDPPELLSRTGSSPATLLPSIVIRSRLYAGRSGRCRYRIGLPTSPDSLHLTTYIAQFGELTSNRAADRRDRPALFVRIAASQAGRNRTPGPHKLGSSPTSWTSAMRSTP